MSVVVCCEARWDSEKRDTCPRCGEALSGNESDSPTIVSLTGYEDCIVGVVDKLGEPSSLCYDTEKILAKIQERDGMSREDAVDFFCFNISTLYAGPASPCFLSLLPEDEN